MELKPLSDERRYQLGQRVRHILEDKDAHFTANWVVRDSLDELFEGQHQASQKDTLRQVVRHIKDVATEDGLWIGLSYADFKELKKLAEE